MSAEQTNYVSCAVRLDGELDVIVFLTVEECEAFCKRRPEYEQVDTGIYTAREALNLFEDTSDLEGGEA